jgi:hypothetical protein
MRWVVPAAAGAGMPAGLMLRNRMINGFITDEDVLTVSRETLTASAPVIARITARAVAPLAGEYAGMIVRLDGTEPHDHTPPDDPAINPLSPGTPRFDYYSLEVVQRIGYDSFCPDNGVLLAKNSDGEGRNGGPNEFNCFNWVIDAHPEDINMVDYVKPNGEKVMRTIADYRQLNDALFHAGLNSGSEFEYVDTHNRLHFYIIDIHKNELGILSYTAGVRSLDSDVTNGMFAVAAPPRYKMKEKNETIILKIKGSDIYRLKAEVDGAGWKAELQNELAASDDGSEITVPLYLSRESNCSKKATVTLRVASECDEGLYSEAMVSVKR